MHDKKEDKLAQLVARYLNDQLEVGKLRWLWRRVEDGDIDCRLVYKAAIEQLNQGHRAACSEEDFTALVD
tara:strand:- start:11304 stop:11513 length:210 start_codon:yes stop_codon:yes gene_type:complete